MPVPPLACLTEVARVLLTDLDSVKDTMRALVKKHPLGYEGYLREKAKDINKEAFAANAEVGVEPAVVSQPAAPGSKPVAVGSEPVATGTSEQEVSKVAA